MHHSHLLPPTLRTHTQPHTSLSRPSPSIRCAYATVYAWWAEIIWCQSQICTIRLNKTDQTLWLQRKHKFWRVVFDQSLAPYLVEPAARLGEWHRDAGAQVAAGSVTVREAGHHPFSLQRGQAHLNHLTKKKHSLGQRVAETEGRENHDNGYLSLFLSVFYSFRTLELKCNLYCSNMDWIDVVLAAQQLKWIQLSFWVFLFFNTEIPKYHSISQCLHLILLTSVSQVVLLHLLKNVQSPWHSLCFCQKWSHSNIIALQPMYSSLQHQSPPTTHWISNWQRTKKKENYVDNKYVNINSNGLYGGSGAHFCLEKLCVFVSIQLDVCV